MSEYNIVMQVSLRDPSPQNLARLRSSIERSLSRINMRIDTGQLSRTEAQLRSLQKTQHQTVKGAHDLAEALSLKALNFAPYAVVSTAIFKIGGAITDAIAEAIKFEKQLSIIAQTVDQSLTATKKYSSEIDKISQSYGVAQGKVAEFVRTFAQAGLSIKDSLKAAETISKTTLVGTFESTTETIEAMIAAMSAFGIKADQMETKLSSINAISKKFAVENSDLVEVIKRSGGAFKAAGGSLEELLAVFTSIRSFSREAPETIATGINTIIGRLQRPETIDYFSKLGISLTDAKGNFIGVYQAIEKISASLDQIGATQGSLRFSEIIEQLGGLRQQPRTIPLLKNFAQSQEALNVALKNGVSLDQDAAKGKETLSFKLDALTASFQSLISQITETAGFQFFVDFLLKASSAAIELTRSIKELIPLILIVGTAKIGAGIARFLSTGAAGSSRVARFAKGGPSDGGQVPGIGDSDSIPALLTPGEFVIKKKAAKKLGLATLFKLNNVAGYAQGGEVDKVLEADVNKYKQIASPSSLNSVKSVGKLESLLSIIEGMPKRFKKELSSLHPDRYRNESEEIQQKADKSFRYMSDLRDRFPFDQIIKNLKNAIAKKNVQKPKDTTAPNSSTTPPKQPPQPPKQPPQPPRSSGGAVGGGSRNPPPPQQPPNPPSGGGGGLSRPSSGGRGLGGPRPTIVPPFDFDQWAADELNRQNKAEGVDLSPEGIRKKEDAFRKATNDQNSRSFNTTPNFMGMGGPNGIRGMSGSMGAGGSRGGSGSSGSPPMGGGSGGGNLEVKGVKELSKSSEEANKGVSRFSGSLALSTVLLTSTFQSYVSESKELSQTQKTAISTLLDFVSTISVAQAVLQEANIGLGDLAGLFSKTKSKEFVSSVSGKISSFGQKLQGRTFSSATGYSNPTGKFRTLGLGLSKGSDFLARGAANAGRGALAGGAVYLAGSALDKLSGVNEKRQQAINSGDIEGAGTAAIAEQGAADLNAFNAGLTGILSMFGPWGTAIGVAISAVLKLASTFTPFGKVMEAVTGGVRNLLAYFNLADDTTVIKARAEAEAANVKVSKQLSTAFTSLERDVISGTRESNKKVFGSSEFTSLAESINVAADKAKLAGGESVNAAKSSASDAFEKFRNTFESDLRNFVSDNVRSGNTDKAGNFSEFYKSLNKNAQTILANADKTSELTRTQAALLETIKKEQIVRDNLNASYIAEQEIYAKRIGMESQLNSSLLTLTKAAQDGAAALSAIQSAANPEDIQSFTTSFADQLGDISSVFDPAKLERSLSSVGKLVPNSGAINAEIQKGVKFAQEIKGFGSDTTNKNVVGYNSSIGSQSLTQKALQLGGKTVKDLQNELELSKTSESGQDDILDRATSSLISSIDGADEAVKTKISDGFKELIKNAEGRINPKDVENLLIETLVTPAQELASKQKAVLEQQIAIMNAHSASLRAINELDRKILGEKLSALKSDQSFKGDLSQIQTGKPITANDIANNSITSQKQILQGVSGSEQLIGNTTALSDAIKSTESDISRLNEQFQNGENLTKEGAAAQEANKARLEKLNQALDEQLSSYADMKSALLDVAQTERDRAKQIKDELLAKVSRPIEERIKGAQANVAANQLIRGQLDTRLLSTQYASQFRGPQQAAIQEQQGRIIESLKNTSQGDGPEAERAKEILNQIAAQSAALDAQLEAQLGGTIGKSQLNKIKKKDENLANIITDQQNKPKEIQEMIFKGTTKKGEKAEAEALYLNELQQRGFKERSSILDARKGRQEQILGGVNGDIQQQVSPEAAVLTEFSKSMTPMVDSMNRFIEMPKEFVHRFESAGMNVNINGAEILAKLPDALNLVILNEINNQIGLIATKVREKLQAGA